MSKKNAITCMALGIASAVLGLNCLYSYCSRAAAGLVCAILSMNFKKKADEEGAGELGFTKAGKITSLVGLILSIIGLVGGLVCGICTCALAGAGGLATALQNSLG